MCCESVVNKVLMGSKRLKNKFKIRLLISSKCHFFFFLSWNQPHLLLLNSVLLKKVSSFALPTAENTTQCWEHGQHIHCGATSKDS